MTVRQKLNIAKGIAQGPCLHAGVACVCVCHVCVARVAKGGSICSQA